MGSGKSSAAINYINDHPEKKFIYITPYLSEAERIQKSCPAHDFQQPRSDLRAYRNSKSIHFLALLDQGENIATTHSLFKMYKLDNFDAVRKYGYVLIIDESLSVIEKFKAEPGVLDDALALGYIRIGDNGRFEVGERELKSGMFSNLVEFVRRRNPSCDTNLDWKSGAAFYWIYEPDFIMSFSEVFVLTYMFNAQDMRYFFDTSGIAYEYIGVKFENGKREFGDYNEYIPPYVSEIKEKIHIYDHKINDIGDKKTALSSAWFKRGGDEVDQVFRNITNLYTNILKPGQRSGLMIGVFSEQKNAENFRSMLRKCVPFNERATNKYKDKNILAYCVNIFMDVGTKLYYTSHGAKVDEDGYALSTMVQWIWRSAIREGHDIWLYVPSKRMRNLLIKWLDDVSKMVPAKKGEDN